MNNSESEISDGLLAEMDATIIMLARVFARRHLAIAENLELTPTQALLAKMLQGHGATKMSDLAALLDVKAPAVSALVDQLERRGFIERLSDASDRRVVRVRITEDGRDALDRVEDGEREYLRRYVGVLSEQELKDLIRMHRALIEASASDFNQEVSA
ncbi:MAG: MarR family transcriptional regulator [Coriobacteriia bacterium]|nr:MarR family transcriptional regulator [Coriobacteriia bacterium]